MPLIKKITIVFSFTHSRRLYLHKERATLSGGGHIAPPPVYSSPERDSAEGLDENEKNSVRSSGASENED